MNKVKCAIASCNTNRIFSSKFCYVHRSGKNENDMMICITEDCGKKCIFGHPYCAGHTLQNKREQNKMRECISTYCDKMHNTLFAVCPDCRRRYKQSPKEEADTPDPLATGSCAVKECGDDRMSLSSYCYGHTYKEKEDNMDRIVDKCAGLDCRNKVPTGVKFCNDCDECEDDESLSTNPAVNPNHYKDYPTGQECIDIIEHLKANPSAACKYIFRCGQKGTPVQDYEKAIRYLEFEIRKIKRECAAIAVQPEDIVYQSWLPALSKEDIRKKD